MLRATIRFLAPGQGGRTTPPQSGYHPQLKLGDLMTSCVVDGSDRGLNVFDFDIEHDVHLRLMFEKEVVEHCGKRIAELLPVGKEIELYEGSQKVAEGRVTQV